ncbi:MAG: HAMP domain-containing sensor histidine kinase [bacterium]
MTSTTTSSGPDTCYAPAARMTDSEIHEYAQSMVGNPVIDTLLKSMGGFLAILNEQRQILVANESFLKAIGVSDVSGVLGLRPGEALQCIHPSEHEGGCGTTEYCATCGVVVAIMTCLGSNEAVECPCSLAVRKEGVNKNLYFSVRAYPLTLGERRLVVLFMQDISAHQRRAVLERSFFAEINSTIASALGRSKLMLTANAERGRMLAEDIFGALIKLAQEVRIQKALVQETGGEFFPLLRLTAVAEVLKEVAKSVQAFPVAQGKSLLVGDKTAGLKFKVDSWLLQRVLGGMVMNALEASAKGDDVRISAELNRSVVTFSVWNRQAIPAEVTKRIFQQNFTTHAELGRGMGTYFMKVIGEQSLGGKVDFSTSETDGTVFRISLKI